MTNDRISIGTAAYRVISPTARNTGQITSIAAPV